MTEFQEGAWYYDSNAKMWKVKTVYDGLVIAKRRYRLFVRAFTIGKGGYAYSNNFYSGYVVLNSDWKIE